MVEVPKLTVSEWGNILSEIQFQPPFRRVADEESDYFDGNQLDSQTLRYMKDLGMAPCIENLIAPTIDSITGREAQNRLDFRVTAETDGTPDELAEAMNEIGEVQTISPCPTPSARHPRCNADVALFIATANLVPHR